MRKKPLLPAALALLCAAFLIVLQAGTSQARQPLPVLMYHHVTPGGAECNEMSVTADRLEADLRWLQDNGYTTVLPRELAEGKDLPEKPVLITFDDGYRSNYDLAYPLLQKYGAKAVISVMVFMQDHCADDFVTWAMCREMTESGLVEIGSHTYFCHNLGDRGGRFDPEGVNGVQRDPAETGEAFQSRVLDDIQLSYDLIAEHTGRAPSFFAYPYGLTEPEADGLIQSLFHVTAVTYPQVADLTRGLYKLPRLTVTMERTPEFWIHPPLLFRLKSGVKTLLGMETGPAQS